MDDGISKVKATSEKYLAIPNLITKYYKFNQMPLNTKCLQGMKYNINRTGEESLLPTKTKVSRLL